MVPPLALMVLLLVSGATGDGWSVTYNQHQICAVEGSTVVMDGTYTHPSGLIVKETYWLIDPVDGETWTDLLNTEHYSDRVQYLGDTEGKFSLKLNNVNKSDEHVFCFRIQTNTESERWLGRPGVTLRVTDLQVTGPSKVTEGEPANMICRSSCSLTDSTFIWYKDDIKHNETFNKNELHLQSVSINDGGSYKCSVEGSEYRSPAQTLTVRYPPKNISTSIRPSGDIKENSTVTLTCSCDGYPPVQSYTWFKGTTSVGRGETYTISNIRSDQSGEYKCRCSNDHGVKISTAGTINVLYPPKNISTSIRPSAYIKENSTVTVTCSCDGYPPVQNYTWFKGTSSVGRGENYTISNIRSDQSGEYKCRCSNEHGDQISTAGTINVLYPPKNISVNESNRGGLLICISDGNPPVLNYTWFKEGEISPVGSAQSYSPLQSGSYYCEAQNDLGSQRSAAVSVIVSGYLMLYAVLGAVALICLLAVICVWRKKKRASAVNQDLNQENLYSDVNVKTTPSTTSPASDFGNGDDGLYAAVLQHPEHVDASVLKSASFHDDEEEIEYASIQPKHNQAATDDQKDEVQYATIRFISNGATARTRNISDDPPVIYSSVK